MFICVLPFLKTYFLTILLFCGRSPQKRTKVRSLVFIACILYGRLSAMRLIWRFILMTEVDIILKNKLQLLFDNKCSKGLNKNCIIALYNTSVDHDKQKRKKHLLSFTEKSCIPIFTEKPVAMVTVMQMRWNYTFGHLFTRNTSWKLCKDCLSGCWYIVWIHFLTSVVS